MTEKLLQSILSSRFISHEARISGEFDSTKDSHQTKFDRRTRILVKLSYREWCDSKVSGLSTFDNNMAMSLSRKIGINQKGRL